MDNRGLFAGASGGWFRPLFASSITVRGRGCVAQDEHLVNKGPRLPCDLMKRRFCSSSTRRTDMQLTSPRRHTSRICSRSPPQRPFLFRDALLLFLTIFTASLLCHYLDQGANKNAVVAQRTGAQSERRQRRRPARARMNSKRDNLMMAELTRPCQHDVLAWL